MMTLTNKTQWLATQAEANKVALGGFLTSLLRAYGRADCDNRARIELMWRENIEREFDMWYNRID